MDLKFLPYSLEVCINNYKRELLFLESTYYEKYKVFEHTKKVINTVLGFPVEKVELAFETDKLVGVWLFTSERKLEDLINVFESYYNVKATKIDLDGFVETHTGIQYFWGNIEYIVGLGIKPYNDKAYIYITLKHSNLYHIGWD